MILQVRLVVWVKPIKVMLKNQSYIEEFAAFRDVLTVSLLHSETLLQHLMNNLNGYKLLSVSK